MMHTCCAFTVTQLHQHHHRYAASEPWKPNVFSCPLLAAQFVLMSRKQKRNGHGDWVGIDTNFMRHMLVPVASSSPPLFNDEIDISTGTSSSSQILDRNAAKGSGTTARGRRLLKIREEKRKREYDHLHDYPAWAKVLEEACKNDCELRAVLGDSIGNPELMRKKVEERVRRKGRDFQKSKTGSVLAYKVSFREVVDNFNPVDSYIWFELFGSPSDRDVDLVGSVIQSGYVMGHLGAFNSSNLQLANSSLKYNPIYDADKGFNVMPSSFHDISNVEFQDNWGQVWVDLGTSRFF